MTIAENKLAEVREELLPTRWSLLSRLKNWDDQESWRTFFDTYWKLIYSVATKAGLNDSDAQEVVQETVITVAKNIGSFKTDPAAGSFKGWLLKITRWRIVDRQRLCQKQQRWVASVSDETGRTPVIERIPDAAGVNLEAIWDEEWEKNLSETALRRIRAKVSARQYQIFDLYVIKQWPVSQVAKTLHVNLGQVYLAKHRISYLLRKELALVQRQM